MSIRWSRAIWWILFALILYTCAFLFIASCSPNRRAVFANGDRAEVIEVHEPDMVPEEKER